LSSILSKSKTWEKCPGENWLSRLAVYMSGVHIQQIAGGGLRLSGMTFLFCNRYLWVYDSTEIQGRNSIKENWDQLFVIFKPPSPNVHPCPVPGFFGRNQTPQDFIQDYFLQLELKRVCKCISITYQYISVSTS
jgi:hypothetical protein